MGAYRGSAGLCFDKRRRFQINRRRKPTSLPCSADTSADDRNAAAAGALRTFLVEGVEEDAEVGGVGGEAELRFAVLLGQHQQRQPVAEGGRVPQMKSCRCLRLACDTHITPRSHVESRT
eukprot:9047682-Pyramimonas_sp.AAC.1